ncbi:hypothetical protein HDU79_001166, partial [Rhizoclosmatium sp. JEL0117]
NEPTFGTKQMAYTGSLLSSLGRVSVAPLTSSSSSSVLLSHRNDSFLSVQTAALESIAATVAKLGGSFGARELARVSAWSFVMNQLQSSPTLALDTWKSLLSILRSAVSTASKVLPVVGGIVIVTAISAIALHVTSVHLPKWKLLKNDLNAQEEQNRIATLEKNQTHHRITITDPTGKSVAELQSEIVALRAELDQYRSLIVANEGKEANSAEMVSYEALSESYMRELETTNAKLVNQLNTLTSEVKIHNTREVILMDELSKSMRDRDESVKALETQVETLKNEKQSVEGRVKGLEEELGELREVFVFTFTAVSISCYFQVLLLFPGLFTATRG